MPFNVSLTEQDVEVLEEGRGLKPNTIADKKRILNNFDVYVEEKIGQSIETLMSCNENEYSMASHSIFSDASKPTCVLVSTKESSHLIAAPSNSQKLPGRFSNPQQTLASVGNSLYPSRDSDHKRAQIFTNK